MPMFEDPMIMLLAFRPTIQDGETPIESVPVDGEPPASLPPADQNLVLLIALPIILLVVGAITFLVKRPAPGETPSGTNGGLVMMGVGFLLTLAALVYLMLAQ